MTREEAITWCDRFNNAWANADKKDYFPDIKYSDTLDQLFYLAGQALRQQEQEGNDWICTLKCTALMEEGMCSHGGLCCLHESQRTIEESTPLTLDELRKMDAPVWLRCYQVDGDGYWCLCKNGIIITPAGNRYDVSEIPNWAFYRQKPEEGNHEM